MKINNGSLLLRSAKSYAEDFGLQVFPCKGKKPVTKHGYKDATDDFTQIEQWWDEDSTHNIAIATGHGIVVLDVDIDHNAGKYGDETLSHLEEEYGPLPDTWMCLTGGGGVHYYFQCDDPNLTVAAGFLPGLDYRGTGGYVIAPPSIHPASGRRYEWEVNHLPEDTPLAPLPDWLHDLMEPKHKGKRASITPGKTEGNPEEKIPVGTRNDTLFRYGCSLRGKGATTEEIHAALQQKNADLCMSPLSEAEIASIAKSIERYEPGYRQEVLPSIIPPDYSDAGNAEVFTKVYQENLLWVGALGWFQWKNQVWEQNDYCAMACAIRLSEEMLNSAIQRNQTAHSEYARASAAYDASGDSKDEMDQAQKKNVLSRSKEFLSHAKASRGASRLKNMIELSKPALALPAAQLDANPFVLNTPDGIVDLRTGTIRPHEAGAYCTKITAATMDHHGADVWADFLDTITCGDRSIQHFLQQIAGMSLFGEVYHEGIVIAYGSGRNGKSTYFNALSEVLGDYAGSIDIKVISTDRSNKGAALATLRGKRLVVTGELEESQRLSVSTLKQISSTDKLVIEEKFKQPETVKPTHTLVLFTNHLPKVASTDEGTWRRLLVIPFNATIPEADGIPNYAQFLIEHAGGAILAWAVEGAVHFSDSGYRLSIPDAVRQATENYREQENWLLNFVEDRCIQDPNARVGAMELYRDYQNWAEHSGEMIRRQNDFNAAMECMGFQKIRPQNKKTWLGLCLNLNERYQLPGFSSENREDKQKTTQQS